MDEQVFRVEILAIQAAGRGILRPNETPPQKNKSKWSIPEPTVIFLQFNRCRGITVCSRTDSSSFQRGTVCLASFISWSAICTDWKCFLLEVRKMDEQVFGSEISANMAAVQL